MKLSKESGCCAPNLYWQSLHRILCLGALSLLALSTTSFANSELLAEAEHELKAGHYQNAEKWFRKLIESEAAADPIRVRAHLGLSHVLSEQGRYLEATTLVQQDIALLRESPQVWARVAELCFQTGEYDQAKLAVQKSLDLDSQNLLAQAIHAHLLVERGEISQATAEYRSFIRTYNRLQPTDAQILMTIGESAAIYARWESVSQVFRFVVNTLCPDALKDDPNCWQACLLSGNLLLEKYNKGQALPEFQAALTINPNCADALVAMARAGLQDSNLETADDFLDRALKVNPNHVTALAAKSLVQILSENELQAKEFLQRAATINPQHQEVLGLLATIEILASPELSPVNLEQLISDDTTEAAVETLPRFAEIWDRLSSRNPKPGLFLETVASTLDARRRYELAEVVYRKAIEVMPQLSGPQTNLGMLYMRTGQIEEAEELLDSAFKADPFHVRVSNMRKVIDVLKTYEAVESEHFVVRAGSQDELLAKVVSDYLEEIYPELTQRYGYEPLVRSQFEIYSAARDQSGHAWFSTRMIGLPWFQTVGASTGKIVALTSPNESEKQFNWMRVIRHEFLHVLTLQKTNYNIPHWLTEAISVIEEQAEMPIESQRLLLQRFDRGSLFDLSDINSGFQRPRGPDDWTLAYSQSEMYARFMLETFGEEALRKLLDEFQASTTTAAAIQHAFSVTLKEFEAAYLKFLDEKMRTVRRSLAPDRPTMQKAQQRVQDQPEDAAALADFALLLVRTLGFQEPVVAQIQAAYDFDPQNPLAAALMASFQLSLDETERALEILESASVASTQEPVFLRVQARAFAAAGRESDAEEVLQYALKRFPLETRFLNQLLDLYDEIGRDVETEKIQIVLEKIAKADYDDLPSRKRLARLAAEEGHHQNAIRWAREGIAVDVLDEQMHRILAQSHFAIADHSQAIKAYENLLLLDKMSIDDEVNFAKALRSGEQPARAVQVLKDLVGREPNHLEATQLLEKLQRTR